jgi:hypothetical protein
MVENYWPCTNGYLRGRGARACCGDNVAIEWDIVRIQHENNDSRRETISQCERVSKKTLTRSGSMATPFHYFAVRRAS